MKKLIAFTLLTLILSTGAFSSVKHFVAFKYKPTVSPQTQNLVIKKFLQLKDQGLRNGSKYIQSIETGKANSPEGADQGMTQGFIVTFNNESDRDYYVGKPFSNDFDPAHESFKQYVGPLLAVGENGKINGVFVFDFNTK